MSQSDDSVTSSKRSTRPYRKGNPLSDTEKQQAAVARKKISHKELKIFVRNPIKDRLMSECVQEGITQAEYIERLLLKAFDEKDKM
ncbi:replication regulatory protein RepA [Scandinavium manionii]|uniref:replication regulatory protein RepA n=1 Tax=Scandinavium manionii TaxID=2926520 RepID=UPI0021653543|nr:replication regulatory protein RepA [Scandinavium manionii]MCS2164427.1 replication regulatory protein RepA [Scandinavium manionii]